MNKHEQVIEILTNARQQIKSLLNEPEDQNHALRIDTTLQREINIHSLTTGTNAPTAPAGPNLGTANTILGQAITKEAVTQPQELQPPAQVVQTLTEKVEDAYKRFANLSAEDILANEEDVVIRGVAKKAGIKGVSKDNPKKIDFDFVQKVKEKIPAAGTGNVHVIENPEA